MNDLHKHLADLTPEQQELFRLLLNERRDQKQTGPQTITRRRDQSTAPLSFSQQRLWFLEQLDPGTAAYNLPQAVRLQGRLDVDVLRRSLNEIVRRHESLRTTFAASEGEPHAVVAPALELDLPIVDLRDLPVDEREQTIQRWMQTEATQPFDLQRGPLLRVRLLRQAADEYILLINIHHIVSDGWSNSVLIREIAAHYQAFAANQPSPLPQLPIQYADFAAWQREYLQSEVLDRHMSYWKQQLDGAATVLALPTDRPRPAVQTVAGARHYIRVPQRLTERLKQISQEAGASLFITLLAGFHALMYRYTGQDDILVGSPVANRNRAEVEPLIGFFVNTLVLRSRFTQGITFRELLQQTRQVALEAQDHQDLPFEKLVEDLHVARDLSRNSLFQVMFALQNAHLPDLSSPTLEITPLETDSNTALFDLSLDLYETSHELRGWFEYSTNLFDGATIERMAEHFINLLDDLSAQPDQPISRAQMLSVAERVQTLVDWNARRLENPAGRFAHHLFEEQAAGHPDNIAVVFEDRQLTYRQLNGWANQVARQLRAAGVGKGAFVGICMDRRPVLIASILGVLKAGAAYVPLDPTYPRERLDYILGDTGAVALLTLPPFVERLPAARPPTILLDAEQPGDLLDLPNVESGITGEYPAYIIYTSGSTSQAKGVVVTHGGLVNLARTCAHGYELHTVARTHLQMARFTFDVFTGDLVRALCTGGKLVLCPHELLLDAPYLYALMQREAIDCGDFVPVVLRNLISYMERNNYRFEHMRVLVCGSDSWFVGEYRHVQQFCRPDARVINGFGITETTIDSAYFDGDTTGFSADQMVPIGRPFPNTQFYILDDELQPMPIGVPGELYVGGTGLAQGYLNQPGLTAERYIPHPFSTTPGARLYKTGDRARYRADGNVEFLGRIDRQLKVRGFRVEPGEIESALMQHPGIHEAAVIAQSTGENDNRLVAYVTAEPRTKNQEPNEEQGNKETKEQSIETLPSPIADEAEARRGVGKGPGVRATEGLNTDALRRFLQEKLPDYMIPTLFMVLDAMPISANGKIDRRALPAPTLDRADLATAYIAPRTAVEEVLAEVWGRVLDLERIGVYDNFFEMGGHSLLATQVMARVTSTFDVDLPLRVLFDHATISGLAAQVESARENAQGRSSPPVVPVARDQDLPLSFPQEQLWVIDQFSGRNAAYVIPAMMRLSGPLDVSVLPRCFDLLMERHEIFRTTYGYRQDRPVQIVHPPSAAPMTTIDLRSHPAAEDEVMRIASELSMQPIDLVDGPIARGVLFQLAADNHVLLFLMHHIVIDEWSSDTIVDEMREMYLAFTQDRAPALPALPVQYADFAHWQRSWFQGEVLERELAYWRQQLAGAPDLIDLPQDRPRPSVKTFQGRYQTVKVPPRLAADLKALSRASGATTFMTLLAAFNVLLYRYASQTDLVVGTPIANRAKLEVERVIGYFLNTLLIRSDLSGNPTFSELVERVRSTCLEAYAHQDLHFEKLVQELRPQRDNNRNPFFTVMFVLNQNYPTPDVHVGDLTASYMPIPRDVARFDLIMYYFESPSGDAVQLNYNTDIFDHSSMTRMLEHFMTLLEHVVQHPAQHIDQLPLMQPWEQERVLSTWNETHQSYPGERCLHELLEAQAAQTPNGIALRYGEESLTYAALNARANQLAHHLQTLGVGPETLVGICLDRSIKLVVGLLAILKAGGAYVPLDPGYPAERLGFMLEDTQAPVVITEQRFHALLPSDTAQLLDLDSAWATIAAYPQTAPDSPTTADNLAYVIYTSGSTGQPKGAMNTHRAIVNRLLWMQDEYQLTAEDRVMQKTPFSFDVSVWEFFWPLITGATLVVARPEGHKDPAYLVDLIASQGITTLHFVPPMLQVFLQEPSLDRCRTLKRVICSGEALPFDLQTRFFERLDCELHNLYGPTEAAVDVTYWHCDRASTLPTVPIGRPVANTEIYLLDRQLQPVPIGVPGELYIGGVQLARGYLNRPALTAEKFIPDPFSGEAGARLYRTGDLARFLPDGAIEYLNRLDHQVKIRGFRIELGEIEAVLRQHPHIRDAAVVARADGAQPDKQLIAYVVPDAQQPAEQAVQDFLKTRLPAYMLPSRLVTLDSFPLTTNGKLDRRALPAPDPTRPELERAYVAPRNATETVLAEILAEVLGVERVGIHDDFFALGGHSLNATQIMVRVREIFRTEIATAAIFDTPTVAGFAQALTAQEAKPGQIEKIAQLHQRIKHLSKADLQKMVQQNKQQ
ncbi:MAG TPA: amino acid adenylation domain-containing protein [Herpetosiphonaceae bacterium]